MSRISPSKGRGARAFSVLVVVALGVSAAFYSSSASGESAAKVQPVARGASDSPIPLLATYPAKNPPHMQAKFSGEVVQRSSRPGCLYLDHSAQWGRPYHVLLVWPSDVSATRDARGRVHVRDATQKLIAATGESVTVYGGLTAVAPTTKCPGAARAFRLSQAHVNSAPS